MVEQSLTPAFERAERSVLQRSTLQASRAEYTGCEESSESLEPQFASTAKKSRRESHCSSASGKNCSTCFRCYCLGVPSLNALEYTTGRETGFTWWLSRVQTLPNDRCNGWVVSRMLEEFAYEDAIASSCNLVEFKDRMTNAGLAPLMDASVPPRKRCAALKDSQGPVEGLLDEQAHRLMIKAIARSIPSYVSGLRCWAAFCDGNGLARHFPASETLVLRYTSMFASYATFNQYLKHLRWAHRFLRLPTSWDSASLKQTLNGMRKAGSKPKQRLALLSKQVSSIVRLAEKSDDNETAAMAAVSRIFLLRVPSEIVPLQWDGEHSRVILTEKSATITLMRRKNLSRPSALERACCCETSGRRLCGVHWLHYMHRHRRHDNPNVFSLSAAVFLQRVRRLASTVDIDNAGLLGTHAFRRGMAQDIVSAGGSLATLLRAGGWHSKAFLSYLRDTQAQDEAVAQIVIDASDSEGES